MKIEKVNDHQIRCTLTSADLIERQLKLSELAYGTEKAKNLFQDMMEQAQDEFGFEADNTPLMIEAIPLSADSIVLIITKMDNPEDIDERIPKMGPLPERAMPPMMDNPIPLDADDSSPDLLRDVKIFAFQNLDNIIRGSRVIKDIYTGPNSLYKDEETGDYFLVLSRNPDDVAPFSNICNMLTEYGVMNASSGTALAFLEEHCKLMINLTAMQDMGEL